MKMTKKTLVVFYSVVPQEKCKCCTHCVLERECVFWRKDAAEDNARWPRTCRANAAVNILNVGCLPVGIPNQTKKNKKKNVRKLKTFLSSLNLLVCWQHFLFVTVSRLNA